MACQDNAIHTGEENTDRLPLRLAVDYLATSSRCLLLIKGIIAIPLYIGMYFYAIAAAVVVFLSFWAILFVGRFPEGMFAFVRGYLGNYLKTSAYYPLLLTDELPPYQGHPLDLQIDPPEHMSTAP